ncbi:MAG: hypothetical protein VB095_02270 [Anaerovorax sp.]|nr:hypothetical protein [Anaerovorax sp.]
MRILRGGNVTLAVRNGASRRQSQRNSIDHTGNRTYSRILAYRQGNKKLSSQNISSGDTNTDLKDAMYKDITCNAAKEVSKYAEKLTETEENSIFKQGKKSNNTKEIIKNVSDFVKNYNNMVSCMSKFNPSDNSRELQFISNCAEKETKALSKVGITVLKGGKLTVDPRVLSKADIEDLEKVFNGNSSFCGKILEKSIQIEEKNNSNSMKNRNTISKQYFDFSI